jgi:hypothetical protein
MYLLYFLIRSNNNKSAKHVCEGNEFGLLYLNVYVFIVIFFYGNCRDYITAAG